LFHGGRSANTGKRKRQATGEQETPAVRPAEVVRSLGIKSNSGLGTERKGGCKEYALFPT